MLPVITTYCRVEKTAFVAAVVTELAAGADSVVVETDFAAAVDGIASAADSAKAGCAHESDSIAANDKAITVRDNSL